MTFTTYEEVWGEITSQQLFPAVDSEFEDEDTGSQPNSPKRETDSEDFEEEGSGIEEEYFIIDSDPLERYTEDVTLIDQEEVASALHSAFNEALANISGTDTLPQYKRKRSRSKDLEVFHIPSQISNFWDCLHDELEADEEIDSLDEGIELIEQISLPDHKQALVSSSDQEADIFGFSSFDSSQDEDGDTQLLGSPTKSAPVAPLTIRPTDLLLPSKQQEPIVVEEIVNPTTIVIEVVQQRPKPKRKSPKRKPSTKTKRRKTIYMSSSEGEEDSEEEIFVKKSKTKRKQENLFKLEEVLTIKQDDNDCEDEDIDIGDLNDCQ